MNTRWTRYQPGYGPVQYRLKMGSVTVATITSAMSGGGYNLTPKLPGLKVTKVAKVSDGKRIAEEQVEHWLKDAGLTQINQ